MVLYYSHTCDCVCGGKLEVKEVHKYYGIPKYIKGHNLTKEKGNFKHGEAIKGKESKLYRTWSEMISRCTNSKHRRTTKLNKGKVIEIRKKYKSGKYTTRQLAKEYNLKSKSTVVFIINKKTWDNI